MLSVDGECGKAERGQGKGQSRLTMWEIFTRVNKPENDALIC